MGTKIKIKIQLTQKDEALVHYEMEFWKNETIKKQARILYYASQEANANNLSDIGIYPAKKSNRIFWTKHLALMRKFWTRSKPTFNDRHRLFQA